MSFFNDMTADAAGILYHGKYDKNTPSGEAAFKLWNFSVNAAPKAGVTLNHTWTKQQEWADAKGNVESEKTVSKIGLKCHDNKWDVTAANDKWSVKASGPLVKDDWKINGSALFEGKPAKEEWKAELSTSITSPDFSGVQAFVNLGAEQVSKKEAGLVPVKVKVDANINFEKDWFVGANFEHDTSKQTEAGFSLVKKEATNKYWLTYDHQRNQARTGCLVNKPETSFTHVYEALYTTKDGKEEFRGFPLVIAAGGKYVLSKESTMTYGVEFKKTQAAQLKFEHKLDKNWKVSFIQQFDASRLGSKRPAYDLGFDVAYTL